MPDEDIPLDFDAFFCREYERLLRAVWLFVRGDRFEAEDLLQEAMARAFERWHRVQAADHPDAYVFTIALNLHRRRMRRAMATVRRELNLMASHDAILAVEDRYDILAAMRRLPRNQQEAVIFVDYLGFPPEEVGQHLGVRPVTIRGRLHRARKTLRAELGGTDG
jgi:RNA polymerase sigma factor (sigma-70 family)